MSAHLRFSYGVMTVCSPVLRFLVALLVFLLATQAATASQAGGNNLARRSYVLTLQMQTKLLSTYQRSADQAKRFGKSLDRGPARYFLENQGIEFPYRAAAVLRDRNHLMVVDNTAENLVRVDRLMEQLYSNTDDSNTLRPLLNEAELAYGLEVFVPAPDFLTALDEARKIKPSEPTLQPFDPQAMDFETLQHSGTVYRNVTVIANTPAELEIMHDSGGGTLPLAELSMEVQVRYQYDPAKAAAFLQSRLQDVAPRFTGPNISPEPSPEFPVAGPDGKSTDSGDFNDAPAEPVPTPERANESERTYERILCRNGRVFENVVVAKSRRGFQVRLRDDPKSHAEKLEMHDAPSKLLLDFEEFDELFRRAVVARDRTQLYELSRGGLEGGTSFKDLAKNPPPGTSFVSVPEGYLFANMNWISMPAPAVELVLPLGRRAFAVADASNLVGPQWWNKHAGHGREALPVPSRLSKKDTSKNGVLYSPFNPETPLLGNTAGEMKRLWVAHHKDKYGALALVETGNGLFFGYYHEHAALEASELTWSDAVREKSGRFSLTKVRAEKIQPGDSLLRLFDASARKVLGAEFKEVGQLKLGGQHFQAMLQRGLEAAVQDRVLPQGDGVRFPESGLESVSSPALDKVVITDQVDAKLKDVLPHAYIFDVESKQRVIEIRKENSGGRTIFRESRPQRRKQNEVVEVPPDLDGGLRLTDGKRVYELKPALRGTELVVWEAERNKLNR
jgi:hypothetical protein